MIRKSSNKNEICSADMRADARDWPRGAQRRFGVAAEKSEGIEVNLVDNIGKMGKLNKMGKKNNI